MHLRIGWHIKRTRGGSHKILERPGFPDYVFAFHDRDEIGPKMLARVARPYRIETGRLIESLFIPRLPLSPRSSNPARPYSVR
jgi:predicted RNA binding protein YcfA (HicA-like mRNA interferase family)